MIELILYYSNIFCNVSFHIHIIPVGINPRPSLCAFGSGIPIDTVYLICSEDISGKVNTDVPSKLKESESEIASVFRSAYKDVHSVYVNPWEYQEILDKVLDIASQESLLHPDAVFHINFTSGTHVLCGAVCSAAFYIGADLYYAMNNDEQVEKVRGPRRFQIPSLPDVSSIGRMTRQVFFLLEEGKTITNRSLLESTGMTPSKLGYHMRVLNGYGLVEKSHVGKEVHWGLTYSGKVAQKVMGRPMVKKPSSASS